MPWAVEFDEGGTRMAGKGEKVSKYETLKLLEKCRRERDEAVQHEGALKEKLRQYESRMRSTESLKQKVKTLTLDNKDLRKQVKTLRAELGLETNPKFNGKTTKDIINDLHEKEKQCSSLIEKTGKLSVTIDELTSELANTVTSKTLLEDQVQSLQQNLKDMTNNQRRLLKLWEDRKSQQREPLSLPALPQRGGLKSGAHKAVQTEMSISSTHILPANAFETKPRREGEKNRNLERRNIMLPNGSHREKTALLPNETKPVHN